MRRQLYYVFKDLKSHKLLNIFLFMQITVSLLLFSVIVSIFFTMFDLKDKAGKINKDNLYLLIDNTDEYNLVHNKFGEEDAFERLKDLYKFIDENEEFESYTVYSSLPYFSEGFHEESVDDVEVDENFSDYFNMETVEGEYFDKEDFEIKGNNIPVVLGYNFLNNYNLNQKIEYRNDKDEVYYYVVKGFLKEDTYYIDPLAGEEVSYLNDTIVIPVNIDNKFLYSNPSDIDTILTRSVIITDDERNLESISEKLREVDLYSFKFRTMEKQIQYLLESIIDTIKYTASITVIIMIFTITGIITSILVFIKKRLREITIHYMCGARIIDVLKRILIQILLLFILAMTIVVYIQGFSSISLITFIFSLLMVSSIIIVPIFKLKNNSINNLLRREE